AEDVAVVGARAQRGSEQHHECRDESANSQLCDRVHVAFSSASMQRQSPCRKAQGPRSRNRSRGMLAELVSVMRRDTGRVTTSRVLSEADVAMKTARRNEQCQAGGPCPSSRHDES